MKLQHMCGTQIMCNLQFPTSVISLSLFHTLSLSLLSQSEAYQMLRMNVSFRWFYGSLAHMTFDEFTTEHKLKLYLHTTSISINIISDEIACKIKQCRIISLVETLNLFFILYKITLNIKSNETSIYVYEILRSQQMLVHYQCAIDQLRG